MTAQPEFSRPLKVDRVPPHGSTEIISADAAECAALAKRFGLAAIHSLAAEIDALPVRGHGLKLTARIRAEIEQTCVVTLDRFSSVIAAEAQRIYLPEGSHAAAADEAEIDSVNDGSVDLGEFTAEELGLALDPYPRKPGVSFQSGTETHPAAGSPFTGLAQLKPRR
jgi:hypothetical protein